MVDCAPLLGPVAFHDLPHRPAHHCRRTGPGHHRWRPTRDGALLGQRLSRRYADRVTGSFTLPGREGRYAPIPDDVPEALKAALQARGIGQLYSHQAQAWEASQRGESVAIVTPTASGKSLC